MCEIKCVMHGLEQRLDVVVMLILLQECLPSRRTWHEHLVWNDANGRTFGITESKLCTIFASGKSWVEVSSVGDKKKSIVRTSAIGLNVTITQLILSTAISHIFDLSIGTIAFMTSSAR